MTDEAKKPHTMVTAHLGPELFEKFVAHCDELKINRGTLVRNLIAKELGVKPPTIATRVRQRHKPDQVESLAAALGVTVDGLREAVSQIAARREVEGVAS